MWFIIRGQYLAQYLYIAADFSFLLKKKKQKNKTKQKETKQKIFLCDTKKNRFADH
jgi:hypothetical protein